MVMDARSGQIYQEENADARVHPASLTKMMTLYIVFEAVEHGELSLDQEVTISANAAKEPPSKLGLSAGQKIKLRYLVRAAAVKSANDAATALGEAVSGSESAFAERMNRTAKLLGMTRTTFKNAHGLTREGHLSTARDMTNLGRHLFYDFPEYYNLFSRLTADAGVRQVGHSNARFLSNYAGADGIKTGYTSAAGWNLVASAQRGNERIITTVMGGRSSAARNAKVAELMDFGFRKAPSNVAVNKPARPPYMGRGTSATNEMLLAGAASKTIRMNLTVAASPIPQPRPGRAPEIAPEQEEILVAMSSDILVAVQAAQAQVAAEAAAANAQAAASAAAQLAQAQEAAKAQAIEEALENTTTARITSISPTPRPERIELAAVQQITAETGTQVAAIDPSGPEVVTRMSTSGGREWGIKIGTYNTQFAAEKELLTVALREMNTLSGALRKVTRGNRGWEANFVGLTQESADLACRKLVARGSDCAQFGPS
ncbi:D-alanyl-D-alanine carboxypeptidase family protein [Aquimixticola soesokkakensis]|nr:D-alanyl-D-alanine carboxypeptidase family protein [Aquimixticola soesokkakensis]